MDELWYASYGSNMDADRLACYVAGGTPRGALPDHPGYPGARDPRLPTQSRPVDLAGSVYFAWHSPTWGGGVAFYRPDLASEPAQTSAARAYRLTLGQFSDVAAQEMGRLPGADLDLDELLAVGHVALGPGQYETLHVVGEIDGLPVVTFTAGWTEAEIPFAAPTAAYLATVARGLRAGHGWDDDRIVAYLSGLRGVGWTPDELRVAVTEAP